VSEEAEENAERWLISYADFITLLFAFFVVLYSSSSLNISKFKAVSNSINDAFDPADLSEETAAAMRALQGPEFKSVNRIVEPIEISRLKDRMMALKHAKMNKTEKNLNQSLDSLISSGKISITQTGKGVRMDISDSILFDTGSATLNSAEAQSALKEIAKSLITSGQSLEIEGHTDNVPIKKSMFANNWDLSALRATAVLNVFSEAGFPEEHLSAIGYGSSRPIASNDTPEGKAKNRRVSILILLDQN